MTLHLPNMTLQAAMKLPCKLQTVTLQAAGCKILHRLLAKRDHAGFKEVIIILQASTNYSAGSLQNMTLQAINKIITQQSYSAAFRVIFCSLKGNFFLLPAKHVPAGCVQNMTL